MKLRDGGRFACINDLLELFVLQTVDADQQRLVPVKVPSSTFFSNSAASNPRSKATPQILAIGYMMSLIFCTGVAGNKAWMGDRSVSM
jgi:hypothetical protein